MAQEKKKSKFQIFTNGLIKENPVLVLVIGTCPTLATSTSVETGFGMGIAATAVLICSNIVISALHKLIPDKVRIPCFITVIAGFVTIVQMLLQAFVPSLYSALGLYLPLIVVNCIRCASWAPSVRSSDPAPGLQETGLALQRDSREFSCRQPLASLAWAS